MKILITGSEGFIGKHLVKKLEKKHFIVKYDLIKKQDVLDPKLLTEKLKKVELVIHLASFISANESWDKQYEYFNNNFIGTVNLIETMKKLDIKNLIFFSSAASISKPQTPYGLSKKITEDYIKLNDKNLNYTIVRPENVYGNGQKANYGYVIHNFIKAINFNKEVDIYGDGNQSRDFIFIDDVVNTVEKIIDKKIFGKIISLGTGQKTSINSLAKIIGKVLKKEVKIKYLAKRIEPRQSVANTKVLGEIGIKYKKFINLEKGIKSLT